MAGNDSQTRTIVIVAIVGMCVLCGLGGVMSVGGYFFYRAGEERMAAQAARAEAEAQRDSQRRAWLDSLPTDERTAIQTFDRGVQVAVNLARDLAEVRPGAGGELADSLGAICLRLHGTGRTVREIHSPSAETTDSGDGRTTEIDVDVVVKWDDGSAMLVVVTLDRAADGTLTASAIEIVDAASESE